MGKQKKSAGPLLHLFDFDRAPPSVANLPAAMTLNGTTVYPTFRYKGGDADAISWKPWGYGRAINIVTGGTPMSYNNGSPLLGPIDDSIRFNAGEYYQSNLVSYGDLNTEDMIVELICAVYDNGVYPISKFKNGANYEGWGIYFYDDVPHFRTINTSLQQAVANGPTLKINSYFYGVFCVRYSDLKTRIWANGSWLPGLRPQRNNVVGIYLFIKQYS